MASLPYVRQKSDPIITLPNNQPGSLPPSVSLPGGRSS